MTNPSKEERCSYCNAPDNGTCAYPSEDKPGCLLPAHRERMRQALTSKVVMTPQETAQFVADCQTLIAHSRTFYEVRDALSKAVALIQSNMQPSETDEKRDRYCPDCGITHCFPVEPAEAITLCAAPGPSGFICERPKGHPGRHCDGDNRSWLPEKASGRYSCGMQGCPGDDPDLATFCPAGDDDK